MGNYRKDKAFYFEAINRLKKEKNAVILGHFYQEPAIQEISDFVGDSLELSRKAAETDADIIVFAGVHFMAETAKILSYDKKVLLPDLSAGCSLADGCTGEDFRKFRELHPDHVAVTYINCSAEVKAYSDLVCTSANAVKVINSIPKDKPILFAPDRNLGRYLMAETGREMLLWDGACVVHEAFSLEKLTQLWLSNPTAQIIAHPESSQPILQVAHFIGSTSAMLRYVQENEGEQFIVATEVGILHQMQQKMPHKTFIPAPTAETNKCSCSECAFMKVNTLEKLYLCLERESPEIHLESSIQKEALKPILKMLATS